MRCSAILAFALLTTVGASARAETINPQQRQPSPIDIRMPNRVVSTTSPHLYAGVGLAGVVAFQQTGPRGYLHRGAGFELTVGARVSRMLALEFAWSSTFHDNELVNTRGGVRPNVVGLQGLLIDAKLYPRATGRVQPFFSGGGGVYFLGENFASETQGPAWGVGAGVDFWLKPWARISLKTMYRGLTLMEDSGKTSMSLATGALDFTGRF